MDYSRRALGANRDQVEDELSRAEAELDALRTRERVLKRLIARARVLLEVEAKPTISDSRPAATGDQLLLHEAMIHVLRDRSNVPMSARELADDINRSGLYRKRDGSPVDAGQIHARVHNYPRLFVREGGRILLREATEPTHDPAILARFDAAMLEVYDAAMREVSYPARRFLYMTRRRGGLEAARHLLAKQGESEGFKRLAEARKLSLTMEYQVLRPEFDSLFNGAELAVARQRLLDRGMTERDLA
jgi:hypothetical protein